MVFPKQMQTKLNWTKCSVFRVKQQIVMKLPLTSKQKFRFGQARPGQAKTELLFWSQQEVRHNLMCHPVVIQLTSSIDNIGLGIKAPAEKSQGITE